MTSFQFPIACIGFFKPSCCTSSLKTGTLGSNLFLENRVVRVELIMVEVTGVEPVSGKAFEKPTTSVVSDLILPEKLPETGFLEARS